MPDLVIDNPTAVRFTVDRERRTIRGLALPYGDVATSKGKRWTFTHGTLSWGAVKVLENHDWSTAFGTATFEDTPEGLYALIKVPETAEGDRVLALSTPDPDTGSAVFDGLSVGIGQDVQFVVRNGVHHVTSAEIPEVSVTPLPAFTRARITSVAASAAQEGNPMDEQELTEKVEALATQVQALAEKVDAEPEADDDKDKVSAEAFSALAEKVDKMEKIKVPVAPAAQFSVTEEPIYRFSGTEGAPSGFDFATDMLAAAQFGDQAALKRVQDFTNTYLVGDPTATPGPEFVATTNTAAVNPAQYRPDMFLGQAPAPTSPLYDTFYAGGLDSVTPFFHSKLDRAATTVGVANHVEGTNPALTNLVTATGATVTPAPVSGRVHITREVADQGGNPNVSGLVWAEFDRSFKIALETKTAALIAASMASITSLTTAIAPGANGQVAGQALEAGLLGLQFQPDGTRFTKAFGHVDLYTALALYENAEGEKRYPIINPQNRSGVAGDKYSFIDVAGYRMTPAHSLGATSANASNSLVADPSAVRVWNSGLTRFDKLQETVEGFDVGCFAYFAGLVYDATGLRKVAYDPTA